VITPEISWIAILPELILAVGAALVLLVEVQWKPGAGVLGAIAAGTVVFAGAFCVLQWAQAGDAVEFGTSGDLLVFSGMVTMDGLAVFGRFVLLVVTGIGLLTGWRYIQSLGRRGAESIALVLLATAGFSIMVASNNLVMMFLGLEVGSIALYVLAGMSREHSRSDEAAIKYFLLGSFASAIFIYGVALLYAGTGQFEVIAIREYLADYVVLSPAVLLIGIGLVVVGLGFKVSAAPFHSWAPDVYQGAPAGLVGYMAAMAKVAGFVAIARILFGLGALESNWLPVVAGMAALSMVLGAVMALVQDDVRRILRGGSCRLHHDRRGRRDDRGHRLLSRRVLAAVGRCLRRGLCGERIGQLGVCDLRLPRSGSTQPLVGRIVHRALAGHGRAPGHIGVRRQIRCVCAGVERGIRVARDRCRARLSDRICLLSAHRRRHVHGRCRRRPRRCARDDQVGPGGGGGDHDPVGGPSRVVAATRR
jgi:hypothetical protein